MGTARSTLTNDEIGHAGETAFAHLCSRAKITANKSERDRNGWDYLVEFPLPERRPGLRLDQRTAAACRVQIKASIGIKPVRLKLSAAEQLAKATGPSLVIALRLDMEGALAGAAAIPLIGPNLAKILRRLREAEARDEVNLNHAAISFDPQREGQAFEPTPEGLKACLAALCGEDPGAYVLEKERQLKELGYEDGRYFINTTLTANNPEDLLDAFLGLRPATTTKFESFEQRFGVRSPLQDVAVPQEGTLHIEPSPTGQCVITVLGSGLQPAARYKVDVYLAPPMPALNLYKIALKHPDLLITISTHELNLEMSEIQGAGPKPLARWINILRTLQNLKDGKGRLRLSEWREGLTTEFPIKNNLSSRLLSELSNLIEGAEALTQLLGRAGIDEATPFTFAELRRATSDSRIAAAMLLTPKTARVEFWIDMADENVDDELTFLHPGHVVAGALQLAYAVRVGFRRDPEHHLKYSSTTIEALDFRDIGEGELRVYGAARAQEHDLPCTFDHLEPWCLEPKGRPAPFKPSS